MDKSSRVLAIVVVLVIILAYYRWLAKRPPPTTTTVADGGVVNISCTSPDGASQSSKYADLLSATYGPISPTPSCPLSDVTGAVASILQKGEAFNVSVGTLYPNGAAPDCLKSQGQLTVKYVCPAPTDSSSTAYGTGGDPSNAPATHDDSSRHDDVRDVHETFRPSPYSLKPPKRLVDVELTGLGEFFDLEALGAVRERGQVSHGWAIRPPGQPSGSCGRAPDALRVAEGAAGEVCDVRV